jgi:uncharacterized protein (DUF433 family)
MGREQKPQPSCSIDALLADYPYLERDDILQAILYAAWRAEECEVELADA